MARVCAAALLVMVAASSAAAAPRSAVRGRVVDARTGQPIAGATVASGGGQPATTGSDGAFELPAADGAVDVFAYADGYAPRTVTVSPQRRLAARIALAASEDGEVIVVEGEAPDQGEPASYDLSRDDVRALPGAGNDVLKAAQSLPGAARIPFGFGGLVLRGMSPRDTNVYLDGIEVPIVYHFGGVTSFYPSTMLEDMTLVPGAFGAGHGRGLGGTVDLTSRPAQGDRWRAGGELSIVDISARAEGPVAGGAVQLGLRRSWIDAVLAAVLSGDDRVLPRYYDGQIRWSRGSLARGEWTLLGFFSLDELLADEARMDSAFVRGALRWRQRWDRTTVSVTPWLGWDRLGFEANEDDEDDDSVGDTRTRYSRGVHPAGLRADATYDQAWGHLAAGVDVQGARYGTTVIDGGDTPFDDDMPLGESGHRWSADVGAWVEAHRRFAGGALAVTPGLRAEHFGLSDQWVAEPRLRVSHQLHPRVTLREAIGLYHQPPVAADQDAIIGNPDLSASSAVHASLGIELDLPGAITTSATGYWIGSRELPVAVEPPPGSGLELPERTLGGLGAVAQELLEEQLGSFEYRDNVGRGRSLGVELIAKRRVGRLVAWIAYTLARTERTDDPARFRGWRPYALDQTHNLSAVVSLRLGDWQLGARGRWVTGNPYTPVIGFTPDGPVYGDPLSERLPDFVQLDLRVDRAWRRDWGTMRVFLDVQNATNRTNREHVDEEEDPPEYLNGLPIFPSFGVEYVPPE